MVLSDHMVKEEIAKGGIVIDLLSSSIRPVSSVIYSGDKFLIFNDWHCLDHYKGFVREK